MRSKNPSDDGNDGSTPQDAKTIRSRGTVLELGRHLLKEELWEPELRFVAMDRPRQGAANGWDSGGSISARARRIEVFLDYLAMKSVLSVLPIMNHVCWWDIRVGVIRVVLVSVRVSASVFVIA